MPLHLDSFVEEKQTKKALAEMLALCAKAQNLISPDGIHFHMDYPLANKRKEEFGKLVFTLGVKDGHLNLLDADITVLSETPTKLVFEKRLPKSGEANEYYNVATADDGAHFQIETVDRYAIKEEIEGTTREVYLTAFPFSFDVYDDIEVFNDESGFKDVKTKNGEVVHGFSEYFMCPNMHEDGEEDPFTFMLGIVKSIDDTRLKLGKITIDFQILQVETGAGIIPVVVSDKVFDLSNLEEGKLIAMNADVKADFCK